MLRTRPALSLCFCCLNLSIWPYCSHAADLDTINQRVVLFYLWFKGFMLFRNQSWISFAHLLLLFKAEFTLILGFVIFVFNFLSNNALIRICCCGDIPLIIILLKSFSLFLSLNLINFNWERLVGSLSLLLTKIWLFLQPLFWWILTIHIPIQ